MPLHLCQRRLYLNVCSGHKVTRFHSTRYQAGTWSRSRRVVIKVEVADSGANTRFVVTHLEQARILEAMLDRVAQTVMAVNTHPDRTQEQRPRVHNFLSEAELQRIAVDDLFG